MDNFGEKKKKKRRKNVHMYGPRLTIFHYATNKLLQIKNEDTIQAIFEGQDKSFVAQLTPDIYNKHIQCSNPPSPNY